MRQYLLPEWYSPDSYRKEGGKITLESRDYHYLVHVLRLSEGDRFPGVDRSGHRYHLKIAKIEPAKLVLSVLPDVPLPPPVEAMDARKTEGFLTSEAGSGPVSGPSSGAGVDTENSCELYLFQAILKGKKMDTVIRQATETGIQHLVPVTSARTIVKFGDSRHEEKKRTRWNTIVVEAVQQSGATRPLKLHPSLALEEIDDFWQKESKNSGAGLFFHQHPLENSSLHGYLSNWPRKLALVVGPEGGFSDSETGLLRSIGFKPVYLQTNILRAETAAIYAIGAIQTILREQGHWQTAHSSPHTRDTVE